LPKKGFNNVFRLQMSEVNLGRLQAAIESKRLDPKGTINGETLVAAGLLSRVRDGVRLLGKGELKTKLTIEVAGASKAAIAAVEKLGGSVIVKAPKPKKEEAKA
jgi:large subunit ribosomal protein L15